MLKNPVNQNLYYSSLPKVTGIEITNRCSLRCKHCFNDSENNSIIELSLFEIESILNEMGEWRVNHLRISGGEPTCHPEFKSILDICKKHHITVSLNTNGIYSQELLEYLKTAPVQLFMISVDGLEMNNDYIRGIGSFRKTIDSCRALIAADQKVMLSFHVGKLNQNNLKKLIELAAEIGADFKVAPIRPIGCAREQLLNMTLSPQDNYRVVKTVTDLRKRYRKVRMTTDFDLLDESPAQADENMAACKAGRTMVNINFDGEIYPCAFFITADKVFSAGNIKSISVTQAWQNSEKFIPFRTHRKSDHCQRCDFYRKKCTGGCPALSYFSSGYLDERDPTCFVEAQ